MVFNTGLSLKNHAVTVIIDIRWEKYKIMKYTNKISLFINLYFFLKRTCPSRPRIPLPPEYIHDYSLIFVLLFMFLYADLSVIQNASIVIVNIRQRISKIIRYIDESICCICLFFFGLQEFMFSKTCTSCS